MPIWYDPCQSAAFRKTPLLCGTARIQMGRPGLDKENSPTCPTLSHFLITSQQWALESLKIDLRLVSDMSLGQEVER